MANLVVAISEAITLNGRDQGGSYSTTIGSITEVFKRLMTIPANNDTTIVRFNTSVHTNDGAIDVNDVRYLRLTNLDGSNSIRVALHIDSGNDDSGAESYITIVLEAGKTFMMGKVDEGLQVDDDAVSIMTDVAALADLESIFVDSGASAVDIELFIACA